ncbi:MAG TPA: type II toxin-antitoxin system RelE/ParE family toxin [Candidatus Sulfotelmatobacter sp.]|nr:type II toxin-antitoxin system RelE/ParE family toxin [Candidatus Sulfotelmatobacter sp.]
MATRFLVLATLSFEREFRKVSRGNQALAGALQELAAILAEDPHNRGGRHQIKKLAGFRPEGGQWRIRWGDYRLRYDIEGEKVVLHSFLHRKEAY